MLVGAEKLRAPVAAAFREKFGVELLEGHGSTEMSPVVAVNVGAFASAAGTVFACDAVWLLTPAFATAPVLALFAMALLIAALDLLIPRAGAVSVGVSWIYTRFRGRVERYL